MSPPDFTPAAAQEKAEELYLESKGQMPLRQIAQLVGRDPAQVSRWKNSGDWETKLADHAIDGMVGFDTAEAEAVLERINWASPEPLSMEEINDIMTVIYKGFLRQLLQKTVFGGININNFYQADQFMARIEATIRRIQGEPDETVKHVHEIEAMPGSDDDDDAIIQGMKRMGALRRMRQLREMQANEDMVETVLITDGETTVDEDGEQDS